MRRVLIALAMIAATAFMASPAIAQEDSTGSNNEPPSSSEAPTTPPSEDPPSADPPAQEDVEESPPAPETTEPEQEPGADANAPDAEGGFEIAAVVERVTICHARSAETNPYGPQAQTVSVQSIVNPNGHGTHTGPVFPDADWGDIIPPFEFEGENGTEQFPGLNWTAEGQAIFFNDCQPTDEEPPPPGEEEITICHADANPQQPYGPGPISPSVNSILNQNGHAGHDGPVFFPGIAEQWGDIIPPFEHENGSFPGLNWDSDGQAIFFNDCQFPGDEDDDDDDGDDGDGDDDGDDGDGDDDNGGALPDTGGQSPWILLAGGLLAILGIAILSNETLGREQVVGRHVKL